MSEKISPRSKKNGYYKGNAPFSSDEILSILVSTILQIIILSLLYSMFIEEVRLEHGTSIIVEIFFVIIWMVMSDGAALLIAYFVKEAYDLFLDYLEKEKKKKPRARVLVQYIIYTISRSFVYALGLVTLLSAFLYPHARIGIFNFSYLLAWLIISLPLKLMAWGLALRFSI